MSLTITIPGAVNVTTGSTAPAVLTIGVGVPGAQGPQGPAGQGVPAGGTAGQFLTKIDGTNYNTDWTTVNLAAYAVKANNLSDLTSASTARSNLGLGTMATATASDYSTTVVNNGLYYPLTGNPSAFLTSASLSGYLTSATAAATYAPIAAGLPTGGTVGQVLTKNSGTDYDDSWQTLIPGDRYVTSSTTSNTIGNGAKTFTVGTGLSYSSQQDVVISYDASNHMHAVVTSYNSGTGVLVVDVRSHTGSGTYTSWTVNVGGTTPLQTVEWGEILGTLGDQTDLANALNAKLETSTAASTYAALAGATFTGEVVTPASTTVSAGLMITPGVAPSAPVNGEIWATSTDLQVRLNGVTETIAEQSWVTAQGYATTSALASYLPLAGGSMTGTLQTATMVGNFAPFRIPSGGTTPVSPFSGDFWNDGNAINVYVGGAAQTLAMLSGGTYTGRITTVASGTATAGFNLPHGAAPTTPNNGDLWTTTGGIFWRQNGSTQQAVDIGSTQTISGNKTFSNANLTLGSSTAAGTINIGSGATISGATKTINIGTGGVAGSTTNINLGTVSGGGATITFSNNTSVNANLTTTGTASHISNSTATQTLNLAAGATLSGSTKTVNIGTAGVAGSTTAIAIGSTTGTSTTTLQGTTNGVTLAADTNSTALATTAYVVGQAGSATPLVDGTAAVGTSLRYARQDHVHPTDTSRAPLASPALTGTPTAPTATAGTNTTQIATTAFVTAAVPAFAAATNVIIDPTSTTLALNPSMIPFLLANSNYRNYANLVQSNVSGSVGVTQFGSCRELYTTSTTVGGTANWSSTSYGGDFGNISSPANSRVINWSKRIWVFGTAILGRSSYLGNANTVCRVNLGGRSSFTSGALTQKGIGFFKVGGTSTFVNLTVHNGTTLTNVATSVTVASDASIHYVIYSDGAGNVQLYLNGTLAASTSAGPTGDSTAGCNVYEEQLESATSNGALSSMHIAGAGVYIQR